MKTMINIKADKEVKLEAQRLAKNLGLSLSDVMNASLRNFIRTREVRVSDIPHMTPELERLLARVERDLETGKNLSPLFKTGKEAVRYLEGL
ncbi:MAG: hypothetical protein A3C11_02125 [Candidatus Sungbacteria bacterium RIFCSPHIGHO2_02_FULL_49_12]|uniref:Damage-inducible protein J n=1 Tax=Candidatus Sungbacteria bacterium RIFCSPHIGHO2_02_FULL_49_12 TaxID=1802271 RepID=A0A1G2KNS6_9BACT|nr:MAG: hypothetical protein A3C11_02125 [Candidatus Sungbacteria bacterium RIFCSPHIGHO2_02_FULL_49_12]